MKHLSIPDDEYQSYLNGEIKLNKLAEKYSVCPKTIINKLNKEGKVSRLKYRQEVQKDDFFDYIDTEEKAYILGFYIGDGCILQGENDSKMLVIRIQKNDEELLHKIKEIISPRLNITYVKERINRFGYESKSMCVLKISSRQIAETLEKRGLGFRKTYKQKSIVNYVPDNLMVHFIRGYFDADGCVSHTNGKRIQNGREYTYNNYIWNIISKDIVILKEINNFLAKNDFHLNIYNDAKGCFLISLTNKKEFNDFYHFLYDKSSIYLSRKKEKFEEILYFLNNFDNVK